MHKTGAPRHGKPGRPAKFSSPRRVAVRLDQQDLELIEAFLPYYQAARGGEASRNDFMRDAILAAAGSKPAQDAITLARKIRAINE